MLVLQIIAVIVALVAVLFALVWFDMRCAAKFGHRFLSFGALLSLTLAAVSYYGGQWWYGHARANGGDTLNGQVLIGIAGLICLIMLIRNFRNAGFIHGLIGSALQAVYLTVFVLVGITLAVICGVCGFFASFAIQSPSRTEQTIVYRNSMPY